MNTGTLRTNLKLGHCFVGIILVSTMLYFSFFFFSVWT